MSEGGQIIEPGDEVEYSLGRDGIEALVVGVEEEKIWIVTGDQSMKRNRSTPSYIKRDDVVEHRPAGGAVTDGGADPTERPQPPESIPKYLREGVQKQDVATLRDLAEYAAAMADYQESEAKRKLEERADQDVDEIPDEWDEEEWEETLEEARERAHLAETKGTLTIKTIDGNDYYYLQWWDSAKEGTSSQYVAPVEPKQD